jgi:EmrB/QacA subfamily drug resistance transporter
VWAVFSVALMSFTGILTETSLNVTFPTMMKQFNVSLNTVQWIATGYLLMIAIIMLGSSYLNQRFTAKQLFAAASITFIVGSLVAAFAPNFWVLLLGRLLSAFGAGISTPLMFNLIVEVMPRARWGFFMGLAGLVVAMAPTLGPAFGGAVNYYLNWLWIFIFVIIFAVLVFAAGMFVLDKYHEQVKQGFDWLSFILLSSALVLTTLSLNQVGRGWRQWQLWTGLAIAAILFYLFKQSSDHSSKKLLDLRVFKHPLFLFGILPYFLLQFINIGVSFVLPNYVQIVNHSSSLIGGLVLLPGSILAGLLNPLFGRFYDQVGGRIALGIGGTTVLIGCSLFMWFGLHLTA